MDKGFFSLLADCNVDAARWLWPVPPSHSERGPLRKITSLARQCNASDSAIGLLKLRPTLLMSLGACFGERNHPEPQTSIGFFLG